MLNDDPRLSRRDLLTLAAAGALVLGLDQLTLAEDGWELGAWSAALATMRIQKRHGVVVVLPPDAAGRKRIAEQLGERIPIADERRPLDPVAPWFLDLVWVLAAGERVQAQPGETLVLVDPQGKRVAGAAVPLGDARGFAEGLEALLAGEGRLDARADAASPEVKKHVANVQRDWPDGDGTGVESRLWFQEHLDQVGSAVLRAWRTTPAGSGKDRLGELLREACAARCGSDTGLPFGVKWKLERTIPEPCPPCGMARATLDGRKFLEFWGS